MKESTHTTAAGEPQFLEGRIGRVCTCTLCLTVFPLIYLIGRVIVGFFN